VSVVASIVVGIALLVAGGAKIAAGPAWPAQARGLGAPAVTIPVVPWVEIVVGALCCVQIAAPWPAAAALALLLSFSVLLGARLAQGLHPPCACFGSWSAKPLSWRHLVRNAALMAVAVVAIVAA
jgi:hypothetical protein